MKTFVAPVRQPALLEYAASAPDLGDPATWVGRSPADVIREQSRNNIENRINVLLTKWKEGSVDFRKEIPSPPYLGLALNSHWWSCTAVMPMTITIVGLPQEADPLRLLASPYPEDAGRLRWLRAVIVRVRAAVTHDVAGLIADALASERVGLTGIRPPRIDRHGVREDVPTSVLRGRRWQLVADDLLIMDDSPITFQELRFSAAPVNPDDLQATDDLARPRQAPDRGYAREDQPLVAEMRRLLQDGSKSSVYAAAQHVAPRAPGSAHADSKAKRLMGRFRREHPGFSFAQH